MRSINKNEFPKHKHLTDIDEVDIDIIVISSKDSYGNKGAFKYFIGYINKYIKPLCIRIPQLNGYVKYFDSNNKYVNFLVHDKELLKKYNAKWNRIRNLLKREFNNESVYNDKYIKSKINLYNIKVNTNFHGNKIPEENECYECLSVILLDSVVKVNEKYFPLILLE